MSGPHIAIALRKSRIFERKAPDTLQNQLPKHQAFEANADHIFDDFLMPPTSMNKTPRHRSALRNDCGVSLVEYALLLVLVAVVSIGAMGYLGTNINDQITFVNKNGFAGGGQVQCVQGSAGYPACLGAGGGGW